MTVPILITTFRVLSYHHNQDYRCQRCRDREAVCAWLPKPCAAPAVSGYCLFMRPIDLGAAFSSLTPPVLLASFSYCSSPFGQRLLKVTVSRCFRRCFADFVGKEKASSFRCRSSGVPDHHHKPLARLPKSTSRAQQLPHLEPQCSLVR